MYIYAIALLVFALRDRSRSVSIWTSSLKQHASQVSENHSATQGFIPLVMTESEPESEPGLAEGKRQPEMVQTLSNTRPTLALSSRGDSDAPLPYGQPVTGSVLYTGSSASLGYHGHLQL